MNKTNLILGLIIAIVTTVVFAASNDQQASMDMDKEAKSIAWYTANIREAHKKNQECYANPELQSSKDCNNSLHALKISYVGVGN